MAMDLGLPILPLPWSIPTAFCRLDPCCFAGPCQDDIHPPVAVGDQDREKSKIDYRYGSADHPSELKKQV
jgi:hypothetical protein